MAQTDCVYAEVVIFRFSPVFTGVEFMVIFSVLIRMENDIFRFFPGEIPVLHLVSNPGFFVAMGENADTVFSVSENIISAASDNDAVLMADQFRHCFRSGFVDLFHRRTHG